MPVGKCDDCFAHPVFLEKEYLRDEEGIVIGSQWVCLDSCRSRVRAPEVTEGHISLFL